MRSLNSSGNERIRRARMLSTRKRRDVAGLIPLEGIDHIREAVALGMGVSEIFVREDLAADAEVSELIRQAGLPANRVSSVSFAVFRKLSDLESVQGVLAVIEKPREIKDIVVPVGKQALIVICDRLQDPGNLGTILRTAAATNVDAVIMTPGTVDPWNPKVVRSSAGAVFRQGIMTGVSSSNLAGILKKLGVPLFAAVPHGGIRCDKAPFSEAVALAIGNEGHGIGSEIAEMAEGMVTVPMPGGSESLNAGVSASILLYEAIRQRSEGRDGGKSRGFEQDGRSV